MNEHKTIYIVYQESIYNGTIVLAAYTDKDKAEEHANQYRHCYYDSVELYE
jgi:hypothetical protein